MNRIKDKYDIPLSHHELAMIFYNMEGGHDRRQCMTIFKRNRINISVSRFIKETKTIQKNFKLFEVNEEFLIELSQIIKQLRREWILNELGDTIK